MKRLLLGLVLITFIITSCSKNEKAPKQDLSKLSLEELASQSSDIEKQFLLNTKITQNENPLKSKKQKRASNEVGVDDPNLPTEPLEAWPKIKFKWGGIKPTTTGCTVPAGICLILGSDEMPEPTVPTTSEDGLADAKITIIGDKMIIEPLTEVMV